MPLKILYYLDDYAPAKTLWKTSASSRHKKQADWEGSQGCLMFVFVLCLLLIPKVAGLKVYLRQTWNFISHALSACISLWHHRPSMRVTDQCMHVLHALSHDITGWCMQLLYGVWCLDFISDIPLPPATLTSALDLLKWMFHKLTCLEQSTFLRYLWRKPFITNVGN